ncbi:MAG: metallophosphoesterase [Actinomycetota bacterium]|nr:metallophosphoesterase [Actinomycetota bacterium]
MRRAAPLLVLALLLVACGGGGGSKQAQRGVTTSVPGSVTMSVPSSGSPSTTALTAPGRGSVATLLAAGDIASCTSDGDEATAALLDARPNAAVATLGDNAYESGTASEFARCYDPTWGRQKSRTHPALGNHEYGVAKAAGYFGEFGATAGEAPLGWYSYDLGDWHIVVLNSNCDVVGCATGGTQERWLRDDLATHPAMCTLAYWHHPRFSSGTTHGSSTAVLPLYTALYDMGADVILTGHEHNYERFAPLDPTGKPDDAKGIREFVVGTGGDSHYPFGPPLPGSEVRNDDTFGLIALTLRATGYQWQFVPEAGKSFTDSGSASCH